MRKAHHDSTPSNRLGDFLPQMLGPPCTLKFGVESRGVRASRGVLKEQVSGMLGLSQPPERLPRAKTPEQRVRPPTSIVSSGDEFTRG